MKARGLSADNVAFGMGGELLQKLNRDTQKFAMKASAICINGEWRDVYKDPITDPGKRSKRGRLALVRRNESVQTVRADALNGDGVDGVDSEENQLIKVFRNGEILIDWDFETIRQRAAQGNGGN